MLKKKNRYNVAVMGATGAVGVTFLSILEERNFPIANLRLLASERSVGKKMKFRDKDYPVEQLTHNSFEGIDIVLASAGASRSLEFLPSAVKSGAVCVDNSSAFRMQPDIPLVVPEVNPHQIKNNKGIIANPNCSTIQMVVALWPIHKISKIRRIVVSTYQSVSGAGQKKVAELKQQTDEFLSGKNITIKEFFYQMAFNLIPQIDVFSDGGYTKEEIKMVNETKKIMEDPLIAISATCIRVPVLYAHSESVNIETEKKITKNQAIEILKNAKGVKIIDDISNQKYPMPIDAQFKDDVFVGRIREDSSIANGLNLWVVSDNLRKGAALNAIQIAEELVR